ncbi:hypothetical protein PMIN03_006483 [Paraphaeosphaeria minitans]
MVPASRAAGPRNDSHAVPTVGKVGRESFTQTGCAEQDGKSVTPHHTHQSPPDTVPTVGTVPSDSKPQLQLLPTYLPTYGTKSPLVYLIPRIAHPSSNLPATRSGEQITTMMAISQAQTRPPTYLPYPPTHHFLPAVVVIIPRRR